MTKSEIAKLLAVLAASYPRFEVDDLKIKIWHEMLGDLDYSTASLAVKKLIALNTFSPSIAELRQAVAEMMTALDDSRIPAPEAWGYVMAAIKKFGYYQESEALNSMPAETAKVVRWMGWRDICQSENIDVVRGQFLRMYETQVQRKKEFESLPPDVKEILDDTGRLLALPDGNANDAKNIKLLGEMKP